VSASLRPRPRARRSAELNLHVLEGIRIWIGVVSVDISSMKGYEIIPEFSLRCPFFNNRGKEEWKWSYSPINPESLERWRWGFAFFEGPLKTRNTGNNKCEREKTLTAPDSDFFESG